MKQIILAAFLLASLLGAAKEYHVSKNGNNKNYGTQEAPFLTIQAAANIAKAGDVITVHEGVYRERVDPKNGGRSDLQRIIYQAADGEKVVIKGSETISKWKKEKSSVWKAVIPNSVFGSYNPYSDLVFGDWFITTGIKHHTGEVYINGKSLFEQNSLEDVINPKECEWAVDKKASLLKSLNRHLHNISNAITYWHKQ